MNVYELMMLAVQVGLGESARVDLLNALGGDEKKNADFRKRILALASDEERHIAEFARSTSGSDFAVLCAIAARHLKPSDSASTTRTRRLP